MVAKGLNLRFFMEVYPLWFYVGFSSVVIEPECNEYTHPVLPVNDVSQTGKLPGYMRDIWV